MSNDKQIDEFIKEWNKSDWERIKKLMDSGYLSNGNKKIEFRKRSREFLTLLIKNHSHIKRQKDFTFQTFKKCCGIRLSDKQYWSRFTSELLRVCREHIKMSISSPDADMFNLLKIWDYFLENGMFANADLIKKRIGTPAVNDSFLSNVWQLYASKLELFDLRLKEETGSISRKVLELISNSKDYLDLHYHENKLMIQCFEIGIQNLIKFSNSDNKKYTIDKEYNIEDIPEKIRAFPQIQLYIYAYLLRLEDKDEHFHELWHLLNEELEREKRRLTRNYLSPLYTILQVHCVSRIRNGINRKEFREYYLEISSKMIEEGMLLEQGKLNSKQLGNMVITYMKLGMPKKAIQFVEDYQNVLLDGLNNPMVRYCLAYKDFVERQFFMVHKRLDEIRRSELKKNPFINIDLKILFLIACLEIGDQTSFKEENRKLKVALNKYKKNVSDDYFDTWKNTAYYLNELHKAERLNKKENYSIIANSIARKAIVVHENWFLSFIQRKQVT